MIFLKRCPKCRGDLVLANDIYGEYMKCLQCGLIKDLAGVYDGRGIPGPDEELKVA